ncbi:MAG: hypothetical protein ACUVTU_07780 [Desulfurispora sp.]|uniref:hypothetical protein n=1 Tax=Desulfurispora sp. TaxID=3014275 RepID=UPI004049E382
MRLIARLPQEQVGFLVDSLRNAGFDRKDMVITDLTGTVRPVSNEEMATEIALVKTESDDTGVEKTAPLVTGMEHFTPGRKGIVVAVEVTKKEADRVRNIMEQCGAMEIIQD